MKILLLPILIFCFLFGTAPISNAQCLPDDANPQLTGMTFSTVCVPETTTTSMFVDWAMISGDGEATAPAGSWQILISFDALERYTFDGTSVTSPGFSQSWDAANHSLRLTTNVAMTYDLDPVIMIPQGTITITVLGAIPTACVTAFSNANIVITPTFLGGCTQAFQNQIGDDDVTSSLGVNDAPLPIELVSFTAEKKGKKALLKWETQNEINNDYFDLQVSKDGRNFISIGEVSGNGTTLEVQSYDFIHDNPFVGLNYYRFKQFDFDGAYEYSPIRTLRFNSEKSYTIYPNPTQGNTVIQIDADQSKQVELKLYNYLGALIKTDIWNVEKGRNNRTLDLSSYNQGAFILSIKDGDNIWQGKVVKIDF